MDGRDPRAVDVAREVVTAQPFNIWTNFHLHPDGTFEIRRPESKAGDHILLRAEMPSVIGISACPSYDYPVAAAERLNGVRIHVDCQPSPSSVVMGTSIVYRQNAIFTACAQPTGTPLTSCSGQDIIVRAQVNFSPSSTPPRTYVQSWSVNS